MKKQEITVGGTYQAKVGARSVEVRIEAEHPKGGWNATAVATGKPVRVKDAKHLRPVKVTAGGSNDPDPAAPPKQPAKDAKRASKKPTRPTAKGTAAGEARAGKSKATAATAPVTGAAPADDAPKRMSCLDAAAAVLKETGQPMQCKAMVEAMFARKLWHTDAPTPAATLYSAILREMKKGAASRFRKTGPGRFGLNPTATTNADATPGAHT